MKITYDHSYPKTNEDGTRKLDKYNQPIIVFVYRITQYSKEEIERYEAIQKANGAKTVKDEKGYLYFTVNGCGNEGELKISTNDKIFVDTSIIDMANSMIKNHGRAGLAVAQAMLLGDKPKQVEAGLGNPEPIDTLG